MKRESGIDQQQEYLSKIGENNMSDVAIARICHADRENDIDCMLFPCSCDFSSNLIVPVIPVFEELMPNSTRFASRASAIHMLPRLPDAKAREISIFL